MKKLNSKGQALIEFAIVLPVMFLIIFSIVDFGRIISTKNSLENISSDAVLMYQDGRTTEEIKTELLKNDNDLDVIFNKENGLVKLNINKEVKPITPGLNKLPVQIFKVNVNRVIVNE